MPCKVAVATEVKRDILDCSSVARREIGDFLVGLQENPFPSGRCEMSESSFYFQLTCGFYVSWEVETPEEALLRIIFGQTEGVLIRVLGVARVKPK